MARKVNLNPITLAGDTIAVWQIRFWRIILLSGIVAVPASLLGPLQIDSTTNLGFVITIAGIYLCVALSWSFLFEKDLMKLNLGKLYLKSSGRVLPYLATLIIFLLVALPVLLSLVVITLGIALEQLSILVFFGLAVSAGSLYFMLRFSLATVLVVQKNITSLQALKLSWQLTRGNIVLLFVAWLAVILTVVVVSSTALWLVGLIEFVRNSDYALALISGLLMTFLLPFFIGYSVQITRRLEK